MPHDPPSGARGWETKMERNELRQAWREATSNAEWQFMCDVAREAADAALDIPTGDHWS